MVISDQCKFPEPFGELTTGDSSICREYVDERFVSLVKCIPTGNLIKLLLKTPESYMRLEEQENKTHKGFNFPLIVKHHCASQNRLIKKIRTAKLNKTIAWLSQLCETFLSCKYFSLFQAKQVFFIILGYVKWHHSRNVLRSSIHCFPVVIRPVCIFAVLSASLTLIEDTATFVL